MVKFAKGNPDRPAGNRNTVNRVLDRRAFELVGQEKRVETLETQLRRLKAKLT